MQQAPFYWQKPLLQALRGDHALCFASISARVGSISDNRLGGWYAYRASKAAQNQLIRTLSIEMARYNPNACVATLHPGTVDTALSKPFQHIPKGGLFTVKDSATMMWSVLNRLTPADSGGFAMMANLFPIEGLIDVASTTQRQRQLQQHEDHTCRRSNKGFVCHPASLIKQTPSQLVGDSQTKNRPTES